MSARKGTINLLPKSEFELSFRGRFLKWALSTGRHIIILTELVVIIAFLSRFKLDQDLADLTDEVNGKQEILKHTANTERFFLQVQRRIDITNSLVKTQSKPSLVIDSVANLLPEGMKLISVTIANGTVNVEAQANDELEVGGFLAQLAKQTNDKGGKRWKSVTLNELATNQAGGVKFNFSAQL
jgi:hypothetical protein